MKDKLKSTLGGWVISKEILEASPGYPSKEELRKKPLIVIECPEEIPCNPCETICPRGAIVVGEPITNLPRIDQEKCNTCGLCIPICPGLAIFLVDNTYSEKEATVSFPYEYYPLPKEGDEVNAVNREGEIACKAKVLKVRDPKSHDHTSVTTIVIPKEYSNQVRGIELQQKVDKNE